MALPSPLSRPTGPYAGEDWFVGATKRSLVEQRLQEFGRNGDYVVRESESVPGAYALCVKASSAIKTFRINKDRGMYYIQEGNACPMLELLITMTQDAGLDDVVLIKANRECVLGGKRSAQPVKEIAVAPMLTPGLAAALAAGSGPPIPGSDRPKALSETLKGQTLDGFLRTVFHESVSDVSVFAKSLKKAGFGNLEDLANASEQTIMGAGLRRAKAKRIRAALQATVI